jgi:methylmalonyl-CoA/ethylmalonyl-CoA epimerase
MTGPILEMRVALTTAEYAALNRFYQHVFGLEPAGLWAEEGRAVIYTLGRATLEIFDDAHAAEVDQLEVGQRVSGPLRFAFEVADCDAVVARAAAAGYTVVHAPIVTPWNHRNARLQSPDGLQITVYQVLGERDV